MGGSACTIIIINGNQAYAAVEKLGSEYNNIQTYDLEAAINASCDLTSFVGLFLQMRNDYLGQEYTQPIIDLHRRIINDLADVDKRDIQTLVDQLARELYAACDKMIEAVDS